MLIIWEILKKEKKFINDPKDLEIIKSIIIEDANFGPKLMLLNENDYYLI